jgi:four helix bundle protein
MTNAERHKAFVTGLKVRSRAFAVNVVVACRGYPRTIEAYIVAKQLIRAATGVASNYRAACRARSRAEFVSRMSVVCEEADESQLWLDITVAARIAAIPTMQALLSEASELTAIFTASRDTAKRKLKTSGKTRDGRRELVPG